MRLKIALLVAGAFLVLVGAVVWAGKGPADALAAIVDGSLGSKGALNGTLRETTPLLIAGLAVFLALRAGLFNIGVEGQLVMGAVTCAVIALKVPGPSGIALGAAGGILAGGLWALPAGLIKAYRGGHEVITTIMLNYVAGYLTLYLTTGPLQAPGQQNSTTERISEGAMLPELFASPPLRVNAALLLGLGLIVLFAVWLRRAVAGYELELVGANPRAAEVAGVRTKRVTVAALTLSGALAGLAGAVQVLAYEGRFYAGFSPGYGFDALGVALLAGGSALGIAPSAFLFGILAKGATAVQFIGVPKGIGIVVVGLLIAALGVLRYRKGTSHD